MHKIFLGIGGNIGNKRDNFDKVYSLIENNLGKIIVSSSIYETPPWGFHSEDNFWNQVLVIESEFKAEEVLERIHRIEDSFGRKRTNIQYNSREMDIDILYYDEVFIETESLIIPHSKIHQRKFVLVPLAEIAPGFKHPLIRLTNLEMLENCIDQSIIKKVQKE